MSIPPSASVKPTSTVTMRVIALLFLLGSALAQGNAFSWGGPDSDIVDNKDSVCAMDPSSCGCCLMQQKVHRLSAFFNITLNELEKQLTNTQAVLNKVRGSRSAFSVALTNEERLNCFGPFRDEQVIVYKHPFLNLGNGYNVNDGVFTAPRSGVYSLALTVYSDAGSPGNTLAACATLQVNDQVVAGPRDKNMQDHEDSATIVVALHLKAGDRVTVKLPVGCFLCDNSSHYNTFTGFLLYATD